MMMIGGNNNNNYYEHQVSTQNEEGGGDGGTNNGGGLTLKKGPWTAAEDAVLAEYVRTHGEGNWNAVQKNTGLARCGKSCRLRWANHLRPNLKKGAFSPEEERIIVELHAIMGNKWARMATRLPGRTDNEIKNYWNTRVKRRQRQGLPLYPPEIQPLYSSQRHCQSALTPSTTSSFSFQNPITLKPLQSSMLTSSASHPHLHYNADPSPPQQLHFYDPHSAATPPPVHSPSPSSTPPPVPSPSTPHSSLPSPSNVSTLQSSHHNPQFSNTWNNNLDFYFPRTSPTLQHPHPHRHKRFRYDESHENNNNNNNGGSSFMLPFSSFNHNLFNPQHYSNPYSLDQSTLDLASSSRMFQSHFDPGQFISTPRFHYPLKNELPSNQYFTQNGNDSFTLDHKGNKNYSSNDDHNSNQHSSSLNVSGNGLLEDMLQEAQSLTDNNEIVASQSCLVGSTSSSEGLNSGLNAKEETKEQIVNTIKHEPMAVHEWFIDNGDGSIGQSSAVTNDNLGFEFELHDQIVSLLPVDTAPDGHERSLSYCSLDHNFSGIC